MTDIKTFVDDLTRLRDEYKNKIKEAGEETIKSALTDLFNNNPQLLAIKWDQYTPYFNDGDECVFSVYDPQYLIDLNHLDLPKEVDAYYETGDDSEDGNQVWFYDTLTYRGEVDESYSGNKYEETERVVKPGSEGERYPRYDYVKTGKFYAYLPIPGCEDIADTVASIFTLPNDVFKDVFGDHVRITVTRDGVEVSESYHD